MHLLGRNLKGMEKFNFYWLAIQLQPLQLASNNE
jgi:hypothetical protein